MKHITTTLILSALSLSVCAQDEEVNQAVAPVIRVMVAGVRAMPVFEEVNGEFIEVEPPLSSVFPTEVSLLTGKFQVDPDAPKPERKPSMTVWPNQILKLNNYKGPAVMSLGLMRPFRTGATVQPITFDITGMITPLVIIHASPDKEGWEEPLARLVELSPEKAPVRSVVMVNLTKVPLLTRFESVVGKSDPGTTEFLRLPENKEDAFRYRIDVSLADGATYPLVNSSYQIKKNQRLVLIAVPDSQAPKGSPPLKLQIVQDS